MENEHPEDGESPFVPKEQGSITGLISFEDEEHSEEYASCPVEGCGEVLLLAELESHVEMHEEEQVSEDEPSHSPKRFKHTPEVETRTSFGTKLSHALRNLDDGGKSKLKADSLPAYDPQASAKAVWKNILKMPEPSLKKKSPSKPGARRRLGVCRLFLYLRQIILTFLQKSELGPYAHEDQMPSWLVKLLKKEDGVVRTTNHYDKNGKLYRTDTRCNMEAGLIPVLHQLLEQDVTVSYAYTCNPSVKHVSKLAREGKISVLLLMISFLMLKRGILWISKYSNVELLYHWSRISRSRGFQRQSSVNFRDPRLHRNCLGLRHQFSRP
jgi:hypothetical protein